MSTTEASPDMDAFTDSRLTLKPRRRRTRSVSELGLGSDRPGGPLIAVGALHGGTGATFLAHTLAAAVARESSVPIVLADASGQPGAMEARCASTNPCGLGAISNLMATRQPLPRPLYGSSDFRLRTICNPSSNPDVPPHPAALQHPTRGLLATLRANHGATIVDCATVTSPLARAVMQAADVALWTVNPTNAGIHSARIIWGQHVASSPSARVLVARERLGGPTPVKALRGLADAMGAALLSVAHAPAADRASTIEAITETQIALTALAHRLPINVPA
ncbi:hypothetical protein GKE82_23735 [Conexibacter sp. W3-3-2]|uniref:hypothetical protein n=1 Tax=Conexibacter sp. W3-3-2 TaxID=2675227 RepID=UPI0012B94F71|nr:hypothetical protein [Conexibacter sp. W3-3-2]MTD47218.1 hypothetical protein [Conexibacter sp. W3-3-2]